MSQPTDSTYNTPLYNSRIIDTYIKLLRKRYPFVDIDELLSSANMKEYEVSDPGHWFTQNQIDLFHQKLVQLTGNEKISREAGRYAASAEALGHVGHWILSHMNPASAFMHFSKITPRFTQSTIVEAKKIHSSKVEVTVTPKENVQEKEFQCQNRIGHFEAIIRIFKCQNPHIEHRECIFRGGKQCKYIISWKEPLFISWKKIRSYLSLTFIIVFILYIFIDPYIATTRLFPGFTIIILILELISIKKEKNETQIALQSLKETSDELIEQSDLYYKNALLSNEFGELLAKQINNNKLYQNLVDILQKRLDYDRGLILIANQDKTKLEFKHGYGYNQKEYSIIRNTSFNLSKKHSSGAFVRCFQERRPFLINDINTIHDNLSLRSLDLAHKLRVSSFICCPIIYEDNAYGVLAVDNVQSKRPLVARDINLLMGIAHFVGISLRNIDLIKSKERQFESMLQVLAASIDARDAMTAGHSENVALYALEISKELGLDRDIQYRVRVAALLHDYGKIAVPDSILKKPDRLTDQEYDMVKSHAMHTEKILQQIQFEGSLEQVPKIAGSHHERLDGSGYPKGLRGKDIPLEAQIIAVADVFEAITATRHYREPMPIAQAFHLLYDLSGIQFDPKIVNALYRYYIRDIDPHLSLELDKSKYAVSS